MIELTNVLKNATATNKPGEKMDAIRGLNEDSQKLLQLAQDPFITFGVKKIPNSNSNPVSSADSENLYPFFNLAADLASRKLTGNAALAEIFSVLGDYTIETAQTLTNVLKKDLRANLGTTLINKVYKKLIPVFKVMLADRLKDKFDWKAGPWLVEYKYDGMRIIAHVTEDTVTYYSRAGIAEPKFVGVFDEFLLALRKTNGPEDLYFDGEVLASTFQETMNARKTGADTSKLVYRVFDLLYATEWITQTCGLGNMGRRERLTSIYVDAFGYMPENPNVILSEGIVCETREDVDDYYDRLTSGGAEGVIIKNMTAPYYWKRNKAWTKYTPILNADLTLVGMYEGTGRNEGRLGGFNLEGELEDGTLVKAGCGSGFSDEQREEFWKDQELIGQTIEVEYREVSQGQKSDLPSLRFPVFKTIRIDK